MARRLETTKPLDSGVEKKNLEGSYPQHTNTKELFSWDLIEETRKRDAEREASRRFAQITGGRFGGYSGIGTFDPEIFRKPLPSLFSATDIGKETINTPTKDKQEARQQEAELENERDNDSITK